MANPFLPQLLTADDAMSTDLALRVELTLFALVGRLRISSQKATFAVHLQVLARHVARDAVAQACAGGRWLAERPAEVDFLPPPRSRSPSVQ